MRRARIPATALLAAMTVGATEAAAQDTRPVPAAGMMADIPGAHERPDPTLDYKIVFDVQTLADSDDQIDPALQAIGGLINTFRHDGVPRSHLHMVAVFHGRTIVVVTQDRTYAQRTGARSNPNDVILQQLSDAGVSLVVCGQSARAQHYDQQSLLPSVGTNLSATVTFINLQTRGYVRVTE